MIKLIIADLDGTLFHDNQISKETKNTIKRLRTDGYYFTIATGRHFTAALPIINELEIDGPVICSNGAYVGIPNKNIILKEVLIDTHLVMQVMEEISKTKSKFLLYTTQRIVSTNESREALYNKIGPFPSHTVSLNEIPLYINEGIVKILIIEPRKDEYESLYNVFTKQDEFSVVSSNNGFIDIGCKQSSKGIGLLSICEYLHINTEEVLAVGDQENDLSMLETAKIGIAMGNATLQLKQSADFVTKTIYDDGFTHAINHFIYKKS